MENKRESAAVVAADVMVLIEKGEMTMNQARAKFGLEPIDEPTADELLKKE